MRLVLLPLLGVEDLLAHADGLGSDLDELVRVDIIQAVLQGHPPRRLQDDRHVLVRASLVSQRLGLDDVDSQVAVVLVLSDDHSLIGVHTRADEHRAALLGILQGIGRGDSAIGGDKDAEASLPDGLVDLGTELAEGVVDDSVSLRRRHEGIHEGDETAGRDDIDKTGLPVLAGHGERLGRTSADKLHDRTGIFVRDVDLQILERLALDPIDDLGDDRRLGDLKLEAFPSHRLDQDREMKLSPSRDDEGFALRIDDEAHRDILLGFLIEAVGDLLGRQKLSFLARKGRGVGSESHPHRRLVDTKGRKGLEMVVVADRLSDHDVRKAGDSADVPALDFLGLDAVQAVEGEELGDLELGRLSVQTDAGDLLAQTDRAPIDTADSDTADILVVIQKRRLELQALLRIGLGSGNGLDDRLEERIHARLLAFDILVERGGGVEGRSVDDRELQLVIIRAQIHEELQDFVEGPFGIGSRTVDLVDDDDRLEVIGNRLLEDKAGLRHRSVEGIDKQTDAIDHVHDPLDLARKVGMPRSVDDVDLVALVIDTRGLGQDRDAALVLQGIGIHAASLDLLIVPEGTAGLEQGIDKGRLSVVDVGDDGNVSDFVVHDTFSSSQKR